MLLIFGLFSLALGYFIMGLPLSFLQKSKSDEELDDEKRFLKGHGTKAAGYALAIALIGILYKIQLYPGSEFMLIVGTISLIILGILAFVRYNESKSEYVRNLLIKIAIVGSLSALLLAIPKGKILEHRFPDSPEYVKAKVNLWADPSNEKLQNKVLEEQAKMMGIPYSPRPTLDRSIEMEVQPIDEFFTNDSIDSNSTSSD